MTECSKEDWKLFRSRIAQWQENYIDKLNKEYIAILQGDENASEKFWKLEERIKKDKNNPGVILQMRKSDMIYNIYELIKNDVIDINDLAEFSDDLKAQIQFLLQ